jgi:hypothetical protein
MRDATRYLIGALIVLTLLGLGYYHGENAVMKVELSRPIAVTVVVEGQHAKVSMMPIDEFDKKYLEGGGK